jgi:hypothetical protein
MKTTLYKCRWCNDITEVQLQFDGPYDGGICTKFSERTLNGLHICGGNKVRIL